MKEMLNAVAVGTLAISLFSGTIAMASVDDTSYGATAVSENQTYTIEEMLTYAIEDEYMAQAAYTAIMDEYGTVRPFSSIAKAEATHIELLLPLFETYGVSVPENDAAERITLPASLAASFDAGVAGEIENITIYEQFLQTEDLPDDVSSVFERLIVASEKHLAAFERGASTDSSEDVSAQDTTSAAAVQKQQLRQANKCNLQ